MLAQTVLKLSRQQQLLFIELEEDLEVREMSLILFLLEVVCISFHVYTVILIVFVKDCPCGLHSIAISFLLFGNFLYHLVKDLLLFNTFLPFDLLVHQVLNDRKTLDLLLASFIALERRHFAF